MYVLIRAVRAWHESTRTEVVVNICQVTIWRVWVTVRRVT
jgi:hypothetical protein